MSDLKHRAFGAILAGAVLSVAVVGVAAAQVDPVKPVDPVRPVVPPNPVKPVRPVHPVEPRRPGGSPSPRWGGSLRAVRQCASGGRRTGRRNEASTPRDSVGTGRADREAGAVLPAPAGYHHLTVAGRNGELRLKRRLRLKGGKQYCLLAVQLPRGPALIAQDVAPGSDDRDLAAACRALMRRWMR